MGGRAAVCDRQAVGRSEVPQVSLDLALNWAAAGWRPIPVRGERGRDHDDGKIPMLKRWSEVASSDPAAIEKYWIDGAGVGLATGRVGDVNVIVVDVDTKKAHKPKSADGRATLLALGFDAENAGTFAARTPSGGLQLYFTTPEPLGTTTAALPGVDTRGEGGQVLAPGTRTPLGAYEVAHNVPIAPLPDLLRRALYGDRAGPATLSAKERTGFAASEGAHDMPGAVEVAAEWLAGQEYVEDGARNAALFKRAAKIRNLGVCRATAVEMMAAHVAEKFDPGAEPLEQREIKRSVASAYDNAQSPFGRDWRPAVDLSAAAVTPDAYHIRWYDGTEATAASIPPRPWLAEGLTMRGVVSVLVAPGATSKSTWTLQYLIAQCLADVLPLETKQDMVGKRYAPALKNAVKALLVNNEDSGDELARRIEAICTKFAIPRASLHGRLAYASGTAVEWRIAARDDKGKIVPGPQFETARAFVAAHSIDVIVFDPFVSFHDAAENSNDEMQRVVSCFKTLAASLNASVMLVHHTSKPPAASSESYAGNINAGRGASAVKDAARVGLTLYTCGTKDGEAYGIAEEHRHKWVRLDDAKQNLVLGTSAPQWYTRESVTLANGDSVGVLLAQERAKLPPPEKKKRAAKEDSDASN
jgi:RecA-family ATPase